MATIQIQVPINGSIEAKRNWIKNIQSDLDAGNDVQFVDESNSPVNIPYIGLFADGTVKFKPVSGDTIALPLAASGFHQIWLNTVFADGTDPDLGIVVKLV